jgi:hypothetical protein
MRLAPLLLVLAVTSTADAAVLCVRRSGAVTVRDACRKKETPLEQLGVSVQGPVGPQGPAGAPGAPGVSVFAATIPSGTTVTGVWAVPGGDGNAGVSFPVPAPSAPGDSDVNFAADASAVTQDDDAACTGTFASPTAPAGRVCLYPDAIGPGVSFLAGYGLETRGFYVYALRSSTSNTAARGSWAYTAP